MEKYKLIKGEKSYKLVVSKNLEEKIRVLCAVFPSTEWSGTLFYETTGSFENNDLTVIAKDVFLQDIGNHTYTEFNTDVTLASYMVENDLLMCEQSLIHSHCDFATFFSGTDLNTLQEEGSEANHFVSLIVNDEGKYTAAITRKVTSHNIVTRTLDYNTFNNRAIVGQKADTSYDETFVEYFMLDITVEKADTPIGRLLERIDEVYENKRKRASKKSNYAGSLFPEFDVKNNPLKDKSFEVKIDGKNNSSNQSSSSSRIQKDSRADDVAPLFKGVYNAFDEEDDEPVLDSDLVPYGTEHIEPHLIENHLKTIVSGDIMAPFKEKLSVKSWAENMPTLMLKRFVSKDDFEYFADTLLEILVADIENAKGYNELVEVYGDDVCQALWAYDLRKLIDTLPKNSCTQYYKNSLEKWMI